MTLLTLPVDILADATNTTNVRINVSQVSQLSVSPLYVSWSQIAPGTNGSVQTITIKNIGSTSFATGIWVSVDSWVNTTNNPTSPNTDASKYMSGSFLVIGNSTHTATDEYWFVNQISWNETTFPNPTGGITTGAVSWGYYWNMSNSWIWELKPFTGDTSCRNGTTSLKIQATPNLVNVSGATSATFMANITQWSTWNISSGPLVNYCIAASSDCKYLMIFKFDKNTSFTCNKDDYITPDSLAPGQSKYFDIKPHIPTGFPSGTLMNSTVTFTAVS
jgi:hypothetical protein